MKRMSVIGIALAAVVGFLFASRVDASDIFKWRHTEIIPEGRIEWRMVDGSLAGVFVPCGVPVCNDCDTDVVTDTVQSTDGLDAPTPTPVPAVVPVLPTPEPTAVVVVPDPPAPDLDPEPECGWPPRGQNCRAEGRGEPNRPEHSQGDERRAEKVEVPVPQEPRGRAVGQQ